MAAAKGIVFWSKVRQHPQFLTIAKARLCNIVGLLFIRVIFVQIFHEFWGKDLAPYYTTLIK
jgi:hypothetical protein